MEKNIYKGVKVSIGFIDVFILVGLVALTLAIVFLSVNGGFDISFDSLGGSEVATQRLRYGEPISKPLPPTREGYIFLGWYEDKSLTKKVDFSSVVATSSTTVYASWQQIK